VFRPVGRRLGRYLATKRIAVDGMAQNEHKNLRSTPRALTLLSLERIREMSAPLLDSSSSSIK